MLKLYDEVLFEIYITHGNCVSANELKMDNY